MTKNKTGGQCFHDAFLLIIELAGKDMDDKNTYLVHGSGWSETHQKRIGHAWVVLNDVVIDPSIDLMIQKDKYYSKAQVIEDATYTATEAMVLALKTKHSGFWTKSEGGKTDKLSGYVNKKGA